MQNKKPDISIVMPAIRTFKWDRMYDTILNSCKKHDFEIILCGPFGLTEKLSKLDNVKWIKDYGSPSRCANIAATSASADLIAHLVDDALFVEGALDLAIEQYQQTCGPKDVLNLRYTEGLGHAGPPSMFKDAYFTVGYHPIYNLAGIPQHYSIAPHHIINVEYFKSMGGYDCMNFEYQNFNLTDLMLRIQHDGGKIVHSSETITHCDWMPGTSGDHRPIHQAYEENDNPKFQEMYSDPDCLDKRVGAVNIDDWKSTPAVWNRRFQSTNLPKNFQELNY